MNGIDIIDEVVEVGISTRKYHENIIKKTSIEKKIFFYFIFIF